MSLVLPSFASNSKNKTGSASLHCPIEEEKRPFISIPQQHVLYRQLRGIFNNLLGSHQNNDRFHGTLPVSLMRSDIPTLFQSSVTYAVIEKTDGLRFFLFFTTFKNKEVALLIDRAFHFYLLNDVLASPKLFLGTIFDVEYVLQKREDYSTEIHTFCVFDLVAHEGKSLIGKKDQHFINRMEEAETIVNSLIFHCPEWNGIEIRMKTPVPISELQTFVQRTLPTRQKVAKTDGLIFVPLENAYHSGQDKSTFKWKDGNDHTIEAVLKLRHSVPEYVEEQPFLSFSSTRIPAELWVQGKDKELVKFADTVIDTTKLAQYGCEENKLLEMDQKVVECRLIHKVWVIEKIRRDRKKPNSLFTVQKTVQNIQEDIRIQELFCACSDCKSKLI